MRFETDALRDSCFYGRRINRCLQAVAGEFVIAGYQELAKQISVALMHEERRCGYFTKQKLRMWALQDDTSTPPEGNQIGS